jgi:hypothetical protein
MARSRLAALVARVTPGTALPLLILYESAPPAPGEVVDAVMARLEAALALGSLDRTRVAHVKISPLYDVVGAGLAMDTILRYIRYSPTPACNRGESGIYHGTWFFLAASGIQSDPKARSIHRECGFTRIHTMGMSVNPAGTAFASTADSDTEGT